VGTSFTNAIANVQPINNGLALAGNGTETNVATVVLP